MNTIGVNKLNIKLPELLKKYYRSEPILQLRARFLYYLCIALMVTVGIILITTTYLHIYQSMYGMPYMPVLIPIFGALVVFLFSFWLLIKGNYNFSANIILNGAFIVVWVVMFNDGSYGISRLDTITFIFAALSMVPLLIDRNRKLILVYSMLNVIVLVVFLLTNKEALKIPDVQFKDYFIDVTTSLVLVGVIGYHIYSINKTALEQAKQNHEITQALIEAAPISISLTDINQKYLLANPAFTNEIGLESSQIVGKSNNEIGLSLSPDGEKQIMGMLGSAGYANQIEVVIRNARGEEKEVIYCGNVLNLKGQQVFLNVMLDVTEKKKNERELHKYQEGLEKLVVERTAELKKANEILSATNKELETKKLALEHAMADLRNAQEQMLQNEKMASLGILTAGVAHEINNPLNFIANGVNAIETLLQNAAPDVNKNIEPFMQAIKTGIKRTTAITKSLGKYSRADNAPFTDVNLNEVIEGCLIILNNQYKGRIDMIKDFTKENASVKANEGQLHQAFLNILVNALQAIEDKGTIKIKTVMEGKLLAAIVEDDGKGIDKKNLKHIFDPFFTTKPPGEGTGLGLAITQKIIHRHNGVITCESIVNKGTIFKVVFSRD